MLSAYKCDSYGVNRKAAVRSSLFLGTAAAVGMYVFFLGTMYALTRSVAMTKLQFRELWYWVLILAVGVGVQVYLLRYMTLMNQAISAKGVVGNVGVSTGAMIACCLHHVSDTVPFLGIAAIAPIATRFQKPLLAFSILLNVIGIVMLMRRLKKHRHQHLEIITS